MKLQLRATVRKQAKARESGANPASRKRDLDFVKRALEKRWLVDTGCGYELVSAREVVLMKRLVSKAQHSISYQSRS